MSNVDKLINLVKGEIGAAEPHGDDKFIKWYSKYTGIKLPLDMSWCAVFVSWAVINAGIDFKPFTRCTLMRDHLRANAQYKTRREGMSTAKAGDLIFYDWDKSGDADHVGVIVARSGDTLTTVEGNRRDRVGYWYTKVTDVTIGGYGLLPADAYVDYDVNGDGKVDANDAKEILQQAVKKKARTKKADVNGDGKVDANDALEVLKKAVRKK